MAIYEPKPIFSRLEKDVLVLMARLILDHLEDAKPGTNTIRTHIVLSDQEAQELLHKLEALVNSRKFLEAFSFVEALTHQTRESEARAREIYLGARRRLGRTRVHASMQWSEFRQRLGIYREVLPGASAVRMTYEYFKEMERKLLEASGIQPQVVNLVMRVIDAQTKEVEDVRRGRTKLEYGNIKRRVTLALLTWPREKLSVKSQEISLERVAGAMTLVADVGVLFTTRDWGVAGTLSTLAGALAATSGSDPRK